MSDQLNADLKEAKRKLKALVSHRSRIKVMTPDRWLEARYHAAVREVNLLSAQVAAQKSAFTGHFA